jgi:hypothetical protein
MGLNFVPSGDSGLKLFLRQTDESVRVTQLDGKSRNVVVDITAPAIRPVYAQIKTGEFSENRRVVGVVSAWQKVFEVSQSILLDGIAEGVNRGL